MTQTNLTLSAAMRTSHPGRGKMRLFRFALLGTCGGLMGLILMSQIGMQQKANQAALAPRQAVTAPVFTHTDRETTVRDPLVAVPVKDERPAFAPAQKLTNPTQRRGSQSLPTVNTPSGSRLQMGGSLPSDRTPVRRAGNLNGG